ASVTSLSSRYVSVQSRDRWAGWPLRCRVTTTRSSIFEQALKANERVGSPPWVAHTEYDYARMLIGRGAPGDHEKAFALLDKAEKTARELGMRSLAENVRRLRASPGFMTPAAESEHTATPPTTSGVFRREGEYWTLAYHGTLVHMKDAKGLRY